MRTHNHIGAMKQLASLEAWKCANALARSAYRLTLQKPLSSHFGLSDQIRRAAVSVPANMVEGYALGTTLQFIRCLRVAFGSAAELHCQLEIARDLDLLGEGGGEAELTLAERVIRLLLDSCGSWAHEPHTHHSPFPIPLSPSRKGVKNRLCDIEYRGTRKKRRRQRPPTLPLKFRDEVRRRHINR